MNDNKNKFDYCSNIFELIDNALSELNSDDFNWMLGRIEDYVVDLKKD